jgi:hypothetical protein
MSGSSLNYDDHTTYSQTQTGGTVPFINFLKSPLNVSVVLFQSAHSPPSTNTYRSKPNCDSKGLIHQIILSFGRYEYCLNLDRFFYNFQVCFGLYCSYNLYRLMWKASGWKNFMLFFFFCQFYWPFIAWLAFHSNTWLSLSELLTLYTLDRDQTKALHNLQKCVA